MHWKMTFRVLLTAAAVASVAVFARTSSGVEPAETDRLTLQTPNEASTAAVNSPLAKDGRHFVGVGGCAAANCHGGDGSKGIVGSEYSIWIQDDKHAEAYSVLYNETSQRMAKLLKLDKPAHQAALCLNCHAPQNDPPFTGNHAHGSLSALLDGVSCEACHGAASDWLGPHVRHDWARKSPAEKAALGFREKIFGIDRKSAPTATLENPVVTSTTISTQRGILDCSSRCRPFTPTCPLTGTATTTGNEPALVVTSRRSKQSCGRLVSWPRQKQLWIY